MIFFFNDTATTEIYTLSLHDALPISRAASTGHPGSGTPDRSAPADAALTSRRRRGLVLTVMSWEGAGLGNDQDRKSTRLNSSHANISYAVFCLKKKKKYPYTPLLYIV